MKEVMTLCMLSTLPPSVVSACCKKGEDVTNKIQGECRRNEMKEVTN